MGKSLVSCFFDSQCKNVLQSSQRAHSVSSLWFTNSCSKRQGYWTKLHQIFSRCREIIAGVNAPISVAILPSTVE